MRSFLSLALAVTAVAALLAQSAAQSKNIVQVSHHPLSVGKSDGGEGLAIQLRPDGRRILYLAHESQRTCLSVIDVTRPEAPELLNQIPSPAPEITRCNSLGLSGNVLLVANQTLKVGQKPAGMWVLDISDVGRVQAARSMQDLAVSFYDTSGTNSRGAHALWFVDGEFAHLATGTADFEPTHPNDDQFYVVVDVRDPRAPKEVGRWWYPGTRKGDACLPGCLPPRHPQFDSGFRAHQTEVWPDHPERLYLAYINGGAFTLDISGLADVKAGKARTFTPTVLARLSMSPPFTGFTHTFQPFFNRGLAVISDESTQDACKDAPRTMWLVDIRVESNPLILATAPLHPTDGERCTAGGRFGAHNIHPNAPGPGSIRLRNTVVASWFNGGVRIFRVTDDAAGIAGLPPHLEEIAFYIPAAISGNPGNAPQINHAIVDDRGLIYANDRFNGGLYILRYTGTVPLD
jgi:hypothetical protein